MKKILLSALAVLLAASLCSCGIFNGTVTDIPAGSAEGSQTVMQNPVTDKSITASETNGTFSMTTSDGAFTETDGVYTVKSSGTYTVSGRLDGQIVVDAGEDDEVVLELDGVTINCAADSPVKAVSCGKLEISAKKETENVINDNRNAKTTDDEGQGAGAIYAKCDLKIKGTGTLVVTGNYSNGIHTTKDLKIQKLSLKVTAVNNAIKGNDSVTVLSGSVVAISTAGDGIKTEKTDADKNGGTRGDITLSGGAVTVYAAGDAFSSAHDFVMASGDDGSAPVLTVFTGSYSGYTASGASTTSYKGIKAGNELNISAGTAEIHSYDDGLHADFGTVFEDGTKGTGTITISGGYIVISVYSPSGKTGGGRFGPRGGWGGQQTVSGADAVHADAVLNITGGTITVDSAYEGLEANVINISGGTSVISAVDDGLNACKGQTTPLISITGGFLDVTVSANGDYDGIDSNGSYRQTGGIVITRGPNSGMAAAIDAEGSVSISGGTLIILGYGRVSTGSGVKSYKLSLNSAGSHTVKIDGIAYSFTNSVSYGATYCYSSVAVST